MVSNRYSAPSVPGTAQRALSGLALSSLTESPRCIGTSVPRMASKIRIFDSGTRYASGLDNLAADHQNPLYESLMASTGAHRTERPLVVIVWSHDSPAEWTKIADAEDVACPHQGRASFHSRGGPLTTSTRSFQARSVATGSLNDGRRSPDCSWRNG
jgi:hypothetical protein